MEPLQIDEKKARRTAGLIFQDSTVWRFEMIMMPAETPIQVSDTMVNPMADHGIKRTAACHCSAVIGRAVLIAGDDIFEIQLADEPKYSYYVKEKCQKEG